MILINVTGNTLIRRTSNLVVNASMKKREKLLIYATSFKSVSKVQVCRLKIMNSMKLVIPLHFISRKKTPNDCCDTTSPESIHTKDESKRDSAFAFVFGVN